MSKLKDFALISGSIVVSIAVLLAFIAIYGGMSIEDMTEMSSWVSK